MVMSTKWLFPLWACAWLFTDVEGHGRMLLPPSRASAWRLGFRGMPVNYDDNQMYCGGYDYQYSPEIGGKCGLCGDPWRNVPCSYERPYGSRVKKTDYILSTFVMNENITAKIDLTAPHKGFFEFYLCNVDSLPNAEEATLECLHENSLYIYEADGTKFYPTAVAQKYTFHLKIPPGLVCHHCVLQWRYHAGNRWGTDDQEEFYACSDISIVSEAGTLPPPTEKPPTSSPITTTKPMPTTTFDYIPDELKNQTDKYPLTEKARRTFLCNYCRNEVRTNPAHTPQLCFDEKMVIYSSGKLVAAMCPK